VEPSATVLLLNGLVSVRSGGRRIFLSAFQSCGAVLNYFGHRLRSLGFDVYSLEPWSIIPGPRAGDVLICLSASLETAPVVLGLVHADAGGLHKVVLTARSEVEVRQRFQDVLPVRIPDLTGDHGAATEALRSLFPQSSLFEVRAFLYLEAVVESLVEVLGSARSRWRVLATRAQACSRPWSGCAGPRRVSAAW